MEVILKRCIRDLGEVGTIVSVKPGYARNFLLPRGFAIHANDKNKKKIESMRDRLFAEDQHRRELAEKVAAGISGQCVFIVRPAGDNGRLFGSVTTRDIADKLNELLVDIDYNIDRMMINVDEIIKNVGIFAARLLPHSSTECNFFISVSRTMEDAKVLYSDMLSKQNKNREEEHDDPYNQSSYSKKSSSKHDSEEEINPSSSTTASPDSLSE